MNKLINEVITDIRKNHKLSRKGLEQISGFKERTIGSYERGEREVSKEYMEFMSLFFGYTENHVKGINYTKLDKFVQTILIYQSIYNYDNQKMADLMEIPLKEYEEKINFNIRDSRHKHNYKYSIYDKTKLFKIAESLGIKPSCIYANLKDYKIDTFLIYGGKDDYLEKYKASKELIDFIMTTEPGMIKNENINDYLENRENKAESNGINITPEYYASIIKKRNQPKDNYTPNDESKEIPPKHKEILDLLAFAPDSFKDTIIDKLKTIKDSQVL